MIEFLVCSTERCRVRRQFVTFYYHLLYEALRSNVAIITTIRVHFIASEPAWLRA